MWSLRRTISKYRRFKLYAKERKYWDYRKAKIMGMECGPSNWHECLIAASNRPEIPNEQVIDVAKTLLCRCRLDESERTIHDLLDIVVGRPKPRRRG